jgi:hypothetical protein
MRQYTLTVGRLVSRLSPERYRMTRLQFAEPLASAAAVHAACRLGQSVERRNVIRYLRLQIEDKINRWTDGCSLGNASLISGRTERLTARPIESIYIEQGMWALFTEV